MLMGEFKSSENITPRQRQFIQSYGNKPVKKIKPPVVAEVFKDLPFAPESEPSYLMTISEVAELFRVSELTLKRWEKKGQIKCIRINSRGDRRYLRSEINKLLGGKV